MYKTNLFCLHMHQSFISQYSLFYLSYALALVALLPAEVSRKEEEDRMGMG